MVGYYTEMYFIDRNIRFIAINDNVDNTVQRDNDITPIKTTLTGGLLVIRPRKSVPCLSQKAIQGNICRLIHPLDILKTQMTKING